MGLIVAELTKQSLINYRNDLEYKVSLITQAKMSLSESAKELLNAGTDLDPENPMVKQLEQRKERLNLLEKKLDTQLAEYKTKLEMVEKEYELAEKMEGDGIKRLTTG